jgi:hypothetical protein
MTAMGMLGALSTVSLGARVDAGGWKEELSLYSMVVMEPGERKSGVMDHVKAPLREIERREREEEGSRLRELRARKEMHEHQRRELLRKQSKTDDPEERDLLWKAIADVDNQLAMFGHLAAYRLLADDVTAEGLTWLLAQHGRIGILAAEGSAIDNIVGAHYSSEGKAAKLDIVLKGYSGEQHIVDRRGRDPEHVERPLLAITLIIQPEYLTGLIDHSRSRSLGLVSRFVYVTPRTIAGNRDPEPQLLDPTWEDAWTCTLTHIHTLLKENSRHSRRKHPSEGGFVGSVSDFVNKPFSIPTLSLDSSSMKRLRELQREIEPKLGPGGELFHIKDWANRHIGRILKTAGHLHLAHRRPLDHPIDLDILSRAQELGEFFMAHGRAALEEPDTTTLRARQVLERWADDTITINQIHRQVFHARGPSAPAKQLAEKLVESGLLEFVQPPRGQKGRPAIQYKINRRNL